jgi:malate permease and related proteins
VELIINSIVPVFILVAIGWFCKRKKIINDTIDSFLNRLAYYVLLPAMIFMSIYKSPFGDIFSLKMIGGLYTASFIVFLLAVFTARFLEKKKRGAFVLPSFRTNIAYIGFPIIMNAYGTLALAQIGVITGFIAPFLIMLSLLYLNLEYRGSGIKKSSVFYYIVSDPLVISSVAGLVFTYFKIPLWKFLTNTVDMLAAMGSPLILIAVGSGLKISAIHRDRVPIFIATVLKLAVQPLIAYLLFIFLMPLKTAMDFKVAVMTFAFPSALSTYIMVKQYKSDAEMTAAIIMVTTLLSIITMSVWILILG